MTVNAESRNHQHDRNSIWFILYVLFQNLFAIEGAFLIFFASINACCLAPTAGAQSGGAARHGTVSQKSGGDFVSRLDGVALEHRHASTIGLSREL
jgi:hypothetical protein